jgi:hypothetical protein
MLTGSNSISDEAVSVKLQSVKGDVEGIRSMVHDDKHTSYTPYALLLPPLILCPYYRTFVHCVLSLHNSGALLHGIGIGPNNKIRIVTETSKQLNCC